ncbi:MAG: DNA-binding response regulator [Anaerolineales bacterium]|nr:response regulator transcription factor [Anaerolineae bacterium]PWB54288.1 MAG: DNA-binding response regulator [Anaerolineales bacterium]
MTNQETIIRVLIVEDHVIVRKGIRALLDETKDIRVIGEANDGLEAVRLADELNPDVLLMDLLMPNMDGIEATRQITLMHPAMHVLVLTSFVGDEKIYPAIKAGAMGYLLKDSEPSELISAIYRVYRGEPFLHPMIARMMMKEIREQPVVKPTPDPLTARELEVLHLLAKGLSNEEIADKLVISEVTVRTHISHLLAKLYLANRVQATLYALREGITSIDSDNA